MKPPRLLCLAVGLGLCLAARAEEPAGDTPPAHLCDLVRADDGTLWGLVTKSYQDPGLYRLENGRWQRVPVTGLPERARPLCQTRRADLSPCTTWACRKARPCRGSARSRSRTRPIFGLPRRRTVCVASTCGRSRASVCLTGPGPALDTGEFSAG